MSDFLKKLEAALPAWLDMAALQAFCGPSLWRERPRQAAMLALAQVFDGADYLARYPDVAGLNMDPVFHFINHGINENRFFKLRQANAAVGQIDFESADPEKLIQAPALSCSVVALAGDLANIGCQYRAFMRQSLKPCEIIYALPADSYSQDALRDATSGDVRIMRVDFAAPAALLAAAQMAAGDCIALFDAGVCPGEYWLVNAVRVCRDYKAIAAARGWMFAPGRGICLSVTPESTDETNISCARSDIYCDCGDKCLVMKREWLALASNSGADQELSCALAVSLYEKAGINCVAPMQPAFDARFHCRGAIGQKSVQSDLTRQCEQFLTRKSAAGYTPVRERDNLVRFHILSVFGERDLLERCVLSVKAQAYANYTFTLIDDCCDQAGDRELIKKYGLKGRPFRYLRNRVKLSAISGYEQAADILPANPADVIVRLDGGDWFCHAHVLWQLNRVYRLGVFDAAYGPRWSLVSRKTRDFSEFACDSMANASSPRSFRYANWLSRDKDAFSCGNGQGVQNAADIASLALSGCMNMENSYFAPDPGVAGLDVHDDSAKNKEAARHEPEYAEALITHSRREVDQAGVSAYLMKNIPVKIPGDSDHIDYMIIYDSIADSEITSARLSVATGENGKRVRSSVVTIATPDHIGDAIMCLQSYKRNINHDCELWLFICETDDYLKSQIKSLFNSTSIKLLFPESLKYFRYKADLLMRKYQLGSDAYRWAMKTVLMLELLESRNDMVLFLDPDIYTVDCIDDLHMELSRHNICVFPHFRNPDKLETRKIMYKDGFYNGGMLAATRGGMRELEKTYWRTYEATERSPEKDLFGVQKYYNLFHLEEEDIFVNKDQGLDYCTWNDDEVAGFVAPGQRAYLLKTGYFARVWHMSKWETIHMIRGDKAQGNACRPLAAVYLLSNLYLLALLAIRARNEESAALYGAKFADRFDWFARQLDDLSPAIPTAGIRALWDNLQKKANFDPGSALKQWLELFMDSICNDNLELFARLLDDFFADEPVARKMASFMRRHDLRYITENIMASSLPDAEKEKRHEIRAAGEIVSAYLERLKMCKIEY